VSPIDRSTVLAHIERGRRGATRAAQGRALEDLICYVLTRVPGVSVTRRNRKNAFNCEEVDVALWNDRPRNGFSFLPEIILVECKNWSRRVTSEELNWFDAKLRSRGLQFGILVAPHGITGVSQEHTAAHSIIASALREGRRLVVLTTCELSALDDSSDLVKLVKEKLCDLAVSGTAW
jgi:hypothetical protein